MDRRATTRLTRRYTLEEFGHCPNERTMRVSGEKLTSTDVCGSKACIAVLQSIVIVTRCIYSLTTSFSSGSIACAPLCCQQRTGPRTRREQGVPFFVLAPQMYVFSSIVVAG